MNEPLPSCQMCSNEVKPGEDYCWSCLGEKMEEELEFDIMTSYSKALLDRLVPALQHATGTI